MSECVCICGHPKSEHKRESGCVFGWGITDARGECNCQQFRPVLDWPDAEGWWWCHSEVLQTICYANAIDEPEAVRDLAPHAKIGDVVILVAGIHGLTDERETKEQFNRELGYGPAKFTKLLETNPFAP